jgi:hypothetical protein
MVVAKFIASVSTNMYASRFAARVCCARPCCVYGSVVRAQGAQLSAQLSATRAAIMAVISCAAIEGWYRKLDQ